MVIIILIIIINKMYYCTCILLDDGSLIVSTPSDGTYMVFTGNDIRYY